MEDDMLELSELDYNDDEVDDEVVDDGVEVCGEEVVCGMVWSWEVGMGDDVWGWQLGDVDDNLVSSFYQASCVQTLESWDEVAADVDDDVEKIVSDVASVTRSDQSVVSRSSSQQELMIQIFLYLSYCGL